MNEVNEALEEVEKEMKTTNKKSLKNKFRTRILKSDPRSATEEVSRTPIAVDKAGGRDDTGTSSSTETPVRTLALVDPRSPGQQGAAGEAGLELTLLLVLQKQEGTGPVR